MATSTRGIANVRRVAKAAVGPPQPRGQLFVAVMGALCAVCGCSSRTQYELAPVHGTVTIAGQPMFAGKVAFAPIAKAAGGEAGKAAVGLVEADGRYVLTTYTDGDGAIVGEHWVTVFVPESPRPPTTGSGEPQSNTPTFKRRVAPQKQVVVAGKDNEINIAL